MKKLPFMFVLFFVVGCSGYENDHVDTDEAYNSPLLYPPCLRK